MAERALIVEESDAVAAALRAQLAAVGLEADVAGPAAAAGVLRKDHALAVVRAGRPDVAAELKRRDPTLQVVLLFQDDDALAAGAEEAARADGVLVGPLSSVAVGSTARAMARLAARERRLAVLERGGRARRSFELHRRLVLLEVQRARRYRTPLAVALVGLDRWPELASGLGRAGRAKVLAEVLGILARSLRTVDVPVLHAEERFLVVMPHTPPAGAMQVATRLCERIAAREGAPALAASAGVACYEGQGTVSLGALLREAGRGLERARAAGGGRAERGAAVRPEKKVDFGW